MSYFILKDNGIKKLIQLKKLYNHNHRGCLYLKNGSPSVVMVVMI